MKELIALMKETKRKFEEKFYTLIDHLRQTTEQETSVFDIKHHNSLTGFRKLDYIASELGFDHSDIASIVGASPATISKTLASGFIPEATPNAKLISEDLYLLRMFFGSFLRWGKYNKDNVARMLHDASEFKSSVINRKGDVNKPHLQHYLYCNKLSIISLLLNYR